MRDAMTPETIRAALHEMTQMEFVWRMLDREYHDALVLALAALDAVARVRTLHHVDEHCWCAGCNNFVYRGCETLRALAGEVA